MGRGQAYLFAGLDHGSETPEQSLEPHEERGIIVTRLAKGFCFDYNSLREPTKRAGRRFVTLAPDDAVVCAKALDRSLVVIATDTGKVLAFPVEQVPVLQGPGQGVKMIKLAEGAHVVGMAILGPDEALRVVPKRGKEKTVRAAALPKANRATAGKGLFSGIREVERRGSDKDRSS
jgi:DNA gyrase subunit A